MEYRAHEVKAASRLGQALALLDPQSRRVMELWLEGRDRIRIAHELQVSEEAAAEIFDVAHRQMQELLSR